MPAINLKGMDVDALLSLRADIDKSSVKNAASWKSSFPDWARKAVLAAPAASPADGAVAPP